MVPHRPGTRGVLVGTQTHDVLTNRRRRPCLSVFVPLVIFIFVCCTNSSFFFFNSISSHMLALITAPPSSPLTLSPLLCVSSLLTLGPVNKSVVQDAVITPGSVRLLADCCRTLYCPDAGLLSQAAGLCGRGAVLCPPECVHCHPLQCTPSILYFPARDLQPSVIPLSSVPQTEGF